MRARRAHSRLSNGRRGITPIVAIILLLLMTIAAAGAAYVWITRLQSIITTGATEQFIQQQQKQNTRLSIETIWAENPTNPSWPPNGTAPSQNILFFVIRNTGTYDIPTVDFDRTTIYVDGKLITFGSNQTGAGAATPYTCQYNTFDTQVNGGFPADAAMKIQCNRTYPGPTGTIYAKIALKVQPPYGSLDTQTYQYDPNS